MAGENTPTPTPTATTPDLSKQLADLTTAVTAIATAQKGLTDTVTQLATAQQQHAAAATATPTPTPTQGGADKPLTRSEMLALLNERDQQRQQNDSVRAARDGFIAQQLKGLPAAYHHLIPQTDDQAKLAEAGKAARAQYEADFKVGGGAKPSVSGDNGGGGQSPANTVDLSKVSPVAKIEMGLKAGDGKATDAQAATATAATK